MESLTLTTSDGVLIAADYYPAEGDRYAILLHMMPATKESWRDFAAILQTHGISSIAIDERGHGMSEGGPDSYKKFADNEQQAKIKDVESAWRELERRGATAEKTVLVGASIGANIAIRYLLEEPQNQIAVALSPGLDYHGVTTNDAVKKLGEDKFILILASEEDEMSFKSSQRLKELNIDQVEFRPQNNIGHGTAMFENAPDLIQAVVDWINARL
ncbi:MAG: alpha/beta fold hydrolase [Patescibacteria group bacterium]